MAKREAPYTHLDGSSCWTEGCSKDHSRTSKNSFINDIILTQSDKLRLRRANTVVNLESKVQEASLQEVVQRVCSSLKQLYPEARFILDKRVFLKDILSQDVFEYETEAVLDTSFISPDGGFLYLFDRDGTKYPILISEVKKQGTNDKRALEGLAKQAKGNAIERLGKNVIGLKTLLHKESIFPFVCFCYGKDFEVGSSIRDRVATIASFAKLNTVHVNDSIVSKTKIGSYFVREAKWSNDEMMKICLEICEKSISYYHNKYPDKF